MAFLVHRYGTSRSVRSKNWKSTVALHRMVVDRIGRSARSGRSTWAYPCPMSASVLRFDGRFGCWEFGDQTLEQGPEKVLVVDDEPQVRNALTRLVRGAGLQAVVAASAEEALALAQGQRFTVVLTDVRMPGMGGLALLQTLSPLQPDARFLVITGTGHVDPALLPRGHRVRVFNKPWDSEELVQALVGSESGPPPISILPPPVHPRCRKHVLLVEGAASDALLFQTALRIRSEEHYQVTTVASLAEARRAVRANRFDVGCLDLSLPDASGLEVIVRMQAEAPELGLVVLCERDDDDFALRAVQSGAQDYLVKGKVGGATLVRALKYAEERKRVELRLAQMALHDQLTGLPNRTLFRQRVAQSLARSRQGRDTFAVILLDLDRFKGINDALGHDAGDAFLQLVAERLRRATRVTDTVARLGGDEFAVLLEPVAGRLEVAQAIQRMISELRVPTELNATRLLPSASVGAAVFPDAGDSADELLAAADAAMYAAKDNGRNTFQVYGAELQSDAAARLELEDSLRRAIEEQNFVLCFQPQVADGGRFLGAEALLRWRHQGRLLEASQFVGVLEDSGLITDLGPWIMNTVFEQMRAWQDANVALHRVAVNLSAKQFADVKLAQDVQRAAERYRLSPQDIELEITERALLHNTEQVRKTLQDLRSAGFRIALDDFGTGYSSLAYLESFPISTIKIDRSFTQDVADIAHRRNLVGGIVGLAGRLGLEVVAEGVETEEQRRVLEAEGCRILQGYLFGRALQAGDFGLAVRQQRWSQPSGPVSGARVAKTLDSRALKRLAR